MDSDLKKDIGIFALIVFGAISWYLADLIPTLILTGRDIVFLGIILEAVSYIVRKLVKKYTGATIADVPSATVDLAELLGEEASILTEDNTTP
jgi:hypothetical protein